jgi:hypothetical protein
MHILKNGQREFLIRWSGYTSKDDTWEPESNLVGKEILTKFLQKVEKVMVCYPQFKFYLLIINSVTKKNTFLFSGKGV